MTSETRFYCSIFYRIINLGIFFLLASDIGQAEVKISDPIFNYLPLTGKEKPIDICSQISEDGNYVLIYLSEISQSNLSDEIMINSWYLIDTHEKHVIKESQFAFKYYGDKNYVYTVDFSTTSQFFICAGGEGVTVFDIANDNSLFYKNEDYNLKENDISLGLFTRYAFWGNPLFSPDSRFYFLPLEDKTLFFYTNNFNQYKQVAIKSYEKKAFPVNLSPDFRFMLRTENLIDINSENFIKKLNSEETNDKLSIECSEFTPDGRFLIATCLHSYDAVNCGLWDNESGQLIYCLNDFYSESIPIGGKFMDLVFTSSGAYFLVARERSLKMYETKTGTLMHQFLLPGLPIHSISITKDEKFLLADQYLYSIPETFDETPVDTPNPVMVTDTVDDNIDLSFDYDYDETNANDFVLKWDFTKASLYTKQQWEQYGNQVDEYHIYVNVNDATESIFLGYAKSNNQNYFVWNKDTPFLNPLFRGGPQPGFQYQFTVYGLKYIDGNFPVIIGPLRNWGLAECQRLVKNPSIENSEKSLIVADDLRSYSDLSGWKDEDDESKRRIYLRWNYPSQEEALDFHLYVKTDNEEKYQYLGRTRYGGVQYFCWESGSSLVTEPFREGPQYGRFYRFKVFPILQMNPTKSDAPITNAGPVWYDSKNPVAYGEMNVIANSELSDDTNPDASQREVELQWNFPVSDVRDYHIYISVDDAPWRYLGRTKNKLSRNFIWREGSDYVVQDFLNGPQTGRQYRFMVYAISKSGSPFFHGPIFSKRAVSF